jgi:hypothetical protein
MWETVRNSQDYFIVLYGETGNFVVDLLRLGCEGFALRRVLIVFKQSEMDCCKIESRVDGNKQWLRRVRRLKKSSFS